MLVARRGSRRMIQDLLRGAPATQGLSEEERRALLVRRWKEVPRGRLLLGLLMLLAPVALLTAVAAGQGPSDVAFFPGPVLIVLAVFMWIGVLQLAFELFRLWRWSRPLR